TNQLFRKLNSMKQKTDNISIYATKEDLKKVEENLGIRLTRTEQLLLAQMNFKFEEMRDYFSAELSKSNKRVLTIVDPLLKELETRREDREIHIAQMEDIKKRITKLEHS